MVISQKFPTIPVYKQMFFWYNVYTLKLKGVWYMENIMKGYVFRLYPNDKQIELIEKSFWCSRYIYNYFLSKNKNYINSYNIIHPNFQKYK